MNAPGAEVTVKRAANTVDSLILAQIGGRTYPPGTIIFPKVGGALLTNKKRILGVEAAFDNNVMGLVPHSTDVNWLYFWILSFDLKSLANTQALPSIRQSDVANLLLDLPPLPEQRRIANRLREQLAEVAKARAAVEAQLDATALLLAARLREIFESRIASSWPRTSLGEAAEVVGGIQKTPDRTPRDFHKQFLTVRNVQRGFLDLTRIERFEVTPAEFHRCRLQAGDILIVEGNGSHDHIGRNALFDQGGDWIHQNHIIRARVSRDTFQPEFVSLFLNSPPGCRQMLDKAKTTTGLYTLSTSKVASLVVPTPSLTEQTTVIKAAKAHAIEVTSLRSSLADRLAAIDRLPAALLRDAFSGKL